MKATVIEAEAHEPTLERVLAYLREDAKGRVGSYLDATQCHIDEIERWLTAAE